MTPSKPTAPQTVFAPLDSVTTMLAVVPAGGAVIFHSSACAFELVTVLTAVELSKFTPLKVTLETVSLPLRETPTRRRRPLAEPVECDQVKLEALPGVHAESKSNMPGTGVGVGTGVFVGVCAGQVPGLPEPRAIRTDPRLSGTNPVASLWTPPL